MTNVEFRVLTKLIVGYIFLFWAREREREKKKGERERA
jgi:hypothetical protein